MLWTGPGAGRDRAELERAADRAAAFLALMNQADGRFVYRLHLDPERTPGGGYNVLRHAGALYALGQYLEARSSDPAAAWRRGAAFLVECCLGPVPGRPGLLALWSAPDLTGRPPRTAKLGGAGLGLAALAGRRDGPALADLRALGRFVLFMQRPDGRFVAKFTPSRGGPQEGWVSLYYPGEAILGLLALHGRDPAGPWLEGALRGLSHLAAGRRALERAPPDHWALLATARAALGG